MSRAHGGVWVAVLGPDGSGKSAVLDEVARLLAPSFQGVHRFHLRPHVGRRRDDTGPVLDPHGRESRGTVASAAKLAVWWLDSWVGFFLRVRPALRASTLVLFDRWFHDLLVDPRRYRYAGSGRLAEWVAETLPRPHLVIVLDAPPDVLRARKREVTEAETARQREAYLRLAGRLSNGVVVDGSRPLAEVAADVAALVERRTPAGRVCA